MNPPWLKLSHRLRELPAAMAILAFGDRELRQRLNRIAEHRRQVRAEMRGRGETRNG